MGAEKLFVTHAMIVREMYKLIERLPKRKGHWKIFGVPRGGIAISYMLQGMVSSVLVEHAGDADLIVDDLIDSGATKASYELHFPNATFEALYDKRKDLMQKWYVFPWETGSEESSADDAVIRQLQYIGEDVNRDGLKDTPARVVKAWDEIFAGYRQDPAEILKRRFKNETGYDQMILLKDIEFFSMCEHHMLPFFGKVHVAYIPAKDGEVLGISKLARLVECFSKRLQIQERLTQQIADAIQSHLEPAGVGVIVEAQHMCMQMRGIKKINSVMVTCALKGVLFNQETRIEMLLLNRK
jgi:GTP cyclohydrolase IA